MESLVYVVSRLAYLLLGAIQLMMFIRIILSWLPLDEESPLTLFIYHTTEVLVYPLRCLMGRSEFVASCPIDLPFFFTFMLLSTVQTLMA